MLVDLSPRLVPAQRKALLDACTGLKKAFHRYAYVDTYVFDRSSTDREVWRELKALERGEEDEEAEEEEEEEGEEERTRTFCVTFVQLDAVIEARTRQRGRDAQPDVGFGERALSTMVCEELAGTVRCRLPGSCPQVQAVGWFEDSREQEEEEVEEWLVKPTSFFVLVSTFCGSDERTLKQARRVDCVASECAFDMMASRGSLEQAVCRGDVEALRWGLERREQTELQLQGDSSLLQLAAVLQQAAVVDFLVGWAGEEAGWASSHAATFRGDLDAIKAASVAELVACTSSGSSLLHLAAFGGQLGVFEWLLKRSGLEFAVTREKDGVGLLHAAAAGGNVALVRLAAEMEQDINARSHGGLTAMHIAASSGHAAVLELLIELGAEVNPGGAKAGSPLLLAASGGRLAAVWVLLRASNGAELGAEGVDVLCEAAFHGWLGVCRRLLVKANVEINGVSAAGRTPLVSAALGKHPSRMHVVDLLLQNGAALGWPGGPQRQRQLVPLHAAAVVGNVRVLERLLCEGADVMQCNDDGVHALHFAAVNGDDEMVAVLWDQVVASGADPRALVVDGMAPINMAAFVGHLGTVKLLGELAEELDNDARERAVVVDRSTQPMVEPEDLAVHSAARGGQVRVAESGADPSASGRSGPSVLLALVRSVFARGKKRLLLSL